MPCSLPPDDNGSKPSGFGATPSATEGAGHRRGAGEIEAENARLRRELASAQLDNEILRKAAAYFARESR